MCRQRLVTYVAPIIAVAGAWPTAIALGAPLCIDLRPDGEFVRRAVTLQLNEGNPLDGVTTVSGYDAGSKTLSVSMFDGRELSFQVIEITAITFEHEVYRPNQAAQGPYSEINVIRSEPFSTTITLSDLTIKDGMLTVNGSQSCSAGSSDLSMEQGTEVHEISRIEFRPEKGDVVVEGTLVEYEIEWKGGGGSMFGTSKSG